MMKFLLKFLPAETRAMVKLGVRITAALDDAEERKAAIAYGVSMLSDGRVTVGEWAKFGSLLGILRGKH